VRGVGGAMVVVGKFILKSRRKNSRKGMFPACNDLHLRLFVRITLTPTSKSPCGDFEGSPLYRQRGDKKLVGGVGSLIP